MEISLKSVLDSLGFSFYEPILTLINAGTSWSP